MRNRKTSSRRARGACRSTTGTMSSLAATRRWSTFWWKRSRSFKRKSSRSIITVSYLNYSGANTMNIDNSKWRTDCKSSLQSSSIKSSSDWSSSGTTWARLSWLMKIAKSIKRHVSRCCWPKKTFKSSWKPCFSVTSNWRILKRIKNNYTYSKCSLIWWEKKISRCCSRI